jgi:hypothetical protein
VCAGRRRPPDIFASLETEIQWATKTTNSQTTREERGRRHPDLSRAYFQK